MAVPKRTTRKARAKSKKKSSVSGKIDLPTMLADKLNKQPIGKALAAIDHLYQELNSMEMRLEILISRIKILKQRTKALRKGETISITTALGKLIGDTPNALGSDSSSKNIDDLADKIETLDWTKIKLLEDTSINDVLLTSGTILSLESRAAASLIKNGVAEALKNTGDVEAEEAENKDKKSK